MKSSILEITPLGKRQFTMPSALVQNVLNLARWHGGIDEVVRRLPDWLRQEIHCQILPNEPDSNGCVNRRGTIIFVDEP